MLTFPATSLNFGWDLSAGLTKCSISAMQNSLTLKSPFLGAISLRNPNPTCDRTNVYVSHKVHGNGLVAVLTREGFSLRST